MTENYNLSRALPISWYLPNKLTEGCTDEQTHFIVPAFRNLSQNHETYFPKILSRLYLLVGQVL